VINLKLDFDGAVTALTGAPDVGQGSSTMIAMAVAEVLGIAIDRVRVIANDSAVTPKDNGSYSSRVTFMVGNAAIAAAKRLKEILVAAAARKLESPPEDIDCIAEVFTCKGSAQSALPFAEVVNAALAEDGTITARGTFTCPPEAQGGKHKGGAVGSTMGFSYAAQVVEVMVDTETGGIRVVKVWAAHDSVWMGLGQALSEETRYAEGLPVHAGLLDYRVPTIVESPDIEVAIVESHDPLGPFGAKEAGEGALSGAPPAFVNAVADAIGVDFNDLPVTPDRVVEALIEARRRARLAASRRAAS
jgi:4-hydroxybenzoyl-CoA reductase subunit alpha